MVHPHPAATRAGGQRRSLHRHQIRLARVHHPGAHPRRHHALRLSVDQSLSTLAQIRRNTHQYIHVLSNRRNSLRSVFIPN